MLNASFEIPIGFKKWERVMPIEHNTMCQVENSLKFTFNFIKDNKLKIFKWKLIHHILATGTMLNQWRIGDGECKICKQPEDYKHLFIECKFNEEFLNYVTDLLKQIGINNNIWTLKNIVFGYKISEKSYYELNLIITIIAFSIYKFYYISDKKSKTSKVR